MAHRTVKQGYLDLADRINRFPQGAPRSDLLFRILELLFSQREAELVAQLPIKPFTAEKAAAVWKIRPGDARAVLDELAGRAILLDIESEDGTTYMLPPPMAGFFEFSMMRVREDLDQKMLSDLLYEYLNEEEEFIRALFTDGETQLGRTFVAETSLPGEDALEVLDFERATWVIESASHRAMAAVLGAILRLLPVKRSMAAGQLGSRCLEKLISMTTA